MLRITLLLSLLTLAACGETENSAVSPPPNGHLEPEFYGAASTPVEGRIYVSDVIVRASLTSTGRSLLTFKVIEYLKGTGPSTITVAVDPVRRDEREAVLFLNRGTSGASSGEFVFTDAHYSAPGYTVDTLDPAWLPAEVSDTSGDPSNPTFITDSGNAPNMSRETISLAEVRERLQV